MSSVVNMLSFSEVAHALRFTLFPSSTLSLLAAVAMSPRSELRSKGMIYITLTCVHL